MTDKDRESMERFARSAQLRAVIYTRVSTEIQEEEGTSLDTQVENCLKYAHEQGYRVIESFREVFTGSLYRERSLLSKLRQMARNREFEILIINTFDRLSRNQTHLAVLIDEMDHLKIQIACVKENFDDTPTGQFMRNALGFVAEVERQKIIERTKAGKRKRVENGYLMPGGKSRYGYRWADEKKRAYAINDAEAEVVREIFTFFTSEKSSLHAVAAVLTAKGIPTPKGGKYWDRTVIYYILTDPIYIGKAIAYRYFTSGRRPVEDWYPLPDGLVPPIIDAATFDKAQEILKYNKLDSRRNNHAPEDTLLRSGFIRCGYCKRAMTVNRREYKRKTVSPHKEVVYRCAYRTMGNPPCKEAPRIDAEVLDPIVWQYVGEVIQDFSLVEKAVALAKDNHSYLPDLHGIENSIRSAQVQQDQLVADLKQAENGIPKLKGRARQLVLDELEKIEEYLSDLEDEKRQILVGQIEEEKIQAEVDRFIAWCLNSRETYPNATYEEKRRALRMLGIVVYIYRSDDENHERYEITVRIPDLCDIVLPIPTNCCKTARTWS